MKLDVYFSQSCLGTLHRIEVHVPFYAGLFYLATGKRPYYEEKSEAFRREK